MELPDRESLEQGVKSYNAALEEIPRAIRNAVENLGFHPLSKARTWKRDYPSHALLMTLRQLRWLTTTLEIRVTLKKVPGFVGVVGGPSGKEKFGHSASIRHLETNCIDHRPIPHPDQPYDYSDSGIRMMEGVEKAIQDATESIRLLTPTVVLLGTVDGIETFAKRQAQERMYQFSNCSYPWFVMAVFEARRGHRETAIAYARKQCDVSMLKHLEVEIAKYIEDTSSEV